MISGDGHHRVTTLSGQAQDQVKQFRDLRAVVHIIAQERQAPPAHPGIIPRQQRLQPIPAAMEVRHRKRLRHGLDLPALLYDGAPWDRQHRRSSHRPQKHAGERRHRVTVPVDARRLFDRSGEIPPPTQGGDQHRDELGDADSEILGEERYPATPVPDLKPLAFWQIILNMQIVEICRFAKTAI